MICDAPIPKKSSDRLEIVVKSSQKVSKNMKNFEFFVNSHFPSVALLHYSRHVEEVMKH